MTKQTFPFKAKLISRPDGYYSQHYPVTVGETYTILDIYGCTYHVQFKDGTDGFINTIRFEKHALPL